MYVSRYDIEDISGMSSSDVSKFLISVKRHLPAKYWKEETTRREEIQKGKRVVKIFAVVKIDLDESIKSTQEVFEREHRFTIKDKIRNRLNTLLLVKEKMSAKLQISA